MFSQPASSAGWGPSDRCGEPLSAVVTFGIFVWIDLTRHWLDAAILVAGGIIGLSFFDWVLAGRSGPVDFKLSLLAAVGWLIYGAATGVVVYRNRPGYRPTVIGFQALAWAGGATLALFTATTMGVLAPLNARQISAGEIQSLTIGLFVFTGMAACAVGLGANISFATGLVSLFAVGFVVVLTVLAYNEIDFSTSAIATQLTRIGEIADDFWPPVWKWPKSLGQPETFNIVEPFIETLQIAIIGATIGNLLAVPLAFWASRMTAPSETRVSVRKGLPQRGPHHPRPGLGRLVRHRGGFRQPVRGRACHDHVLARDSGKAAVRDGRRH